MRIKIEFYCGNIDKYFTGDIQIFVFFKGLMLREIEKDIFHSQLQSYHLIQASKSFILLDTDVMAISRDTISMISIHSAEETNWKMHAQQNHKFAFTQSQIHISLCHQLKRY